MTRLLHIKASPKGALSASGRMAGIFLDEYVRLHPDHAIVTMPLFDKPLPEFGEDEILAKFSPLFGDEVNDAQARKWDAIRALIDEFAAFDKIVLSTPMWNGSIPYRLKHYFDILVQPLLTWGFDLETGEHFGLLKDRPLQLILTRSSIAPGDPADFQLPYLNYILGFIGIADIRQVVASQTTKFTAAERAAYLDSFAGELQAAAQSF